MAEPNYNQGGLIGFDETTTGGNTNSGNNSSAPQEPINPPIPTPPVTPKPTKTSEPISTDKLKDFTSVSVKPNEGIKTKRTLREILNEDDETIEKIAIGDFSEKGKIRIAKNNLRSIPVDVVKKEFELENHDVNIEPGRLYLMDTNIIHDAQSYANETYQFFFALTPESYDTVQICD